MSAAILSACGFSDLWKYVCNNMECHLHCSRDFITCDLKTNEIEVEPNNVKCTVVELLSKYCMERDNESVDDDQ